jgi:hypothetical protein
VDPHSPALDSDYPLGEDPGIRERVVVSPALGVFEPAQPTDLPLRNPTSSERA